MRKSSTFMTAALAGVLAAAAATTVSARADAPHHDQLVHQTMIFDEPFQGGAGAYIDLGSKGIGPGDMFLGHDVPLYSHATGKRIGTEDAAETIMAGVHDGVVDEATTIRLPHGLVMLGGVVRHDDVPYRLAVLGGTGRYVNARGELTQLREDRQRKTTVLRLDLYR
jgi:hypothetical protein